MVNLKNITEKLKTHLEQLKNKFEEGNKPPKDDREFFAKVKQETEPIFDLLENWEAGALTYIKEAKSVLHFEQINSTKENMESLILHSYYIDIRKRRYMEMNKSCLYVFNQLLKEIQNEK